MKGERKHRYFRLKEDICACIEANWDHLIPTKKSNTWSFIYYLLIQLLLLFLLFVFPLETQSWMNSVSSVLSSNDKIFVSGTAIKSAPGWWALLQWEPPIAPQESSFKRRRRSYGEEKDSESEELLVDESSEGDVNGNENGHGSESDLIVDDEDEEEEEVNTTRNTEAINTPPGNANNTTQPDIIPSAKVEPSANLKQQLLERLLMMDSSLLQDAIKKAKAKKEEFSNDSGSLSSLKPPPPVSIPIPPKTREMLDGIVPFIRNRLTVAPVIRASPYENDLLKKCNRVDFREIKVAARLRRKLLVRRQRRQVNLMLFDLDQWIYLYLKSSTDAPLLLLQSTKEDVNDALRQQPLEAFPPTFDLQSIPYIVDPSKSLYVKLTGMAALYGTCPYPIISPFTGKTLPEFIAQDPECQVPKLTLLNQILSLRNNETETDYFETCILPSNVKHIISTHTLTPPPLILKYTNIRKEFVNQLNDLLSESFWPGIDVSEALECPDYAILALVGLSVVGCAICNPDGYLSYLYVRPDFQGHSISERLLALLLPLLASHKDLTLHVSVSNAPAILLYQRIGFKPEEFVVNFYDKYLQDASNTDDESTSITTNKNAFFMRLRR